MKNLLITTLVFSLFSTTHTFAFSPVYVNKIYTSKTQGYGKDAFSTINEALLAVDRGGVVYVAEGTYNEALLITKPVTIIGSGKLAKTGSGTDAPLVYSGNATSTITIDGRGSSVVVTLRNLTVSGGTYGIAALQNAYVTVMNSTVKDYKKNGITFGPTMLEGLGDVRGFIQNNIITGTGLTDSMAQNGIQIAENNTAVITGNTISNHLYNQPGKKWATGILIHQTKGVVISKNTFTNNQVGVNILQADSNTVSNNSFSGTAFTKAGIMVTSLDKQEFPTTNNTISRNTINGGNVGIWSSYASGNSYMINTVLSSTQYGLYFWDSDANTISSNILRSIHGQGNDAYGVALDGGDTQGTFGSDDNYLSSNIILQSDHTFFNSENSQNNTLVRNQF